MKTFMETLLEELEHESIGTRKMLALVPADKGDWKPHEKSMKLKDLATHIADLPSWITLSIAKDELDFATNPYNPKNCDGGEQLVKYFDECFEEAKKHLKNNNDSILDDTWTLKNGDVIYAKYSRLNSIRHSLCQIIHHRAQLGVYLRLLNIPIPGVYGPSADDQSMM